METPAEVKEAAARKGLSIKTMCKKAGLTTSAWHRWNNGRATTVKTVQKMLDAIAAEPEPE